jgi:hypothetical protein
MGVMCAMNRVNSTLSCENNDLLMGYLKTAIGFPGAVVPDQGGQSTSYGSANGGMFFRKLILPLSSIHCPNRFVQEISTDIFSMQVSIKAPAPYGATPSSRRVSPMAASHRRD